MKRHNRVFPRLFRHGGFVSPIWGAMQVDKVLMGAHEGGHRPYEGGPNFKRLFHKLKVLLLLLILI